MWRVHELLLLLQEAKKLPLSGDEGDEVRIFEAALDPREGWSQQSLACFPIEVTALRVRGFLKSLRRHIPAKPARDTRA
jgi:IS1 family transposase